MCHEWEWMLFLQAAVFLQACTVGRASRVWGARVSSAYDLWPSRRTARRSCEWTPGCKIEPERCRHVSHWLCFKWFIKQHWIWVLTLSSDRTSQRRRVTKVSNNCNEAELQRFPWRCLLSLFKNKQLAATTEATPPHRLTYCCSLPQVAIRGIAPPRRLIAVNRNLAHSYDLLLFGVSELLSVINVSQSCWSSWERHRFSLLSLSRVMLKI